MNTNILKTLAVVCTTVLFVSCDKDYNTIGGDIIGGENFDFTPGEEFGIKVYNQKLGEVQTNGLSINQLGWYEHPVFGETRSNFVTQLSLGTVNPKFGENVVLDSVVLSIPYFSKKTVDSNGKATYELLNVNGSGAIDLAVFRNTYELGDYDPNNDLTTLSKYYSNQDATFNNYKSGVTSNVNPLMGDTRLNDKNYDPLKPWFPNENIAFKPSAEEFKKYKVVSTKSTANPYVMEHKMDKTQIESRIAPALRMRLNEKYFEDNIVKAASTNLETNAAFKKYFKGLYFQVKNIVDLGEIGNTTSLDFRKGNITIYYKEDKIVAEEKKNPQTGVIETVILGNDRPMKTLVLNMSGNTVNTFNNNQSYIPGYNPTATDADNLFIKGGDGSVGFIELFTDSAKLQELKDKKPLLNEASLTFTVNETVMTSTVPSVPRLYLYDAESENVLIDYSIDRTANVSDAKKNKYIFDGILEEIKDDAGIVVKKVYKFRITEFVNRILKGEQDNVRLAVVVSDDINDVKTNELKTSIPRDKFLSGGKNTITKVPSASIYNPLGTVLYGSNGDNRVKFIINYTTKN